MEWANLQGAQRDHYVWFHDDRECKRWDPGECNILANQLESLNVAQSPYLPEPVCGEPRGTNPSDRRDIFFLGINPGLTGRNDAGCLRPGQTGGVEAYANHHLQWYGHGGDPAFVAWYDDSITGAALGILMARAGIALHGHSVVRPGHPDYAIAIERGLLRQVVTLNTAHCKSPARTGPPNAAALDCCGRRSFEIVKHYRPKAVVCFGWPWDNWLYRAARGVPRRHVPSWVGAEWQTGFDPQQLRHLPLGATVTIKHVATGAVVAFIRARHPSSQQYHESFGPVVDALQHVLG